MLGAGMDCVFVSFYGVSGLFRRSALNIASFQPRSRKLVPDLMFHGAEGKVPTMSWGEQKQGDTSLWCSTGRRMINIGWEQLEI